MGALFIVATPIGNLSDISTRALDALRACDLVACEDTRQTLKLLNHFGIRKPLTSYHDFNEEQKAIELGRQIAAGLQVVLVSDAGTPTISDPGYRLVRYCRRNNLPVVPIPGPSALIAALSASGLPSDEFFFAGFLPPKKSARREKLEALRPLRATLIFYESPHRIREMLADAEAVLGARDACLARELTKVHEEFLAGSLADLRENVKELGEFVVMIAGAAGDAPVDRPPPTRESVLKTLNMSRNELYDLFFKKS